jgi:hypothetical protein
MEVAIDTMVSPTSTGLIFRFRERLAAPVVNQSPPKLNANKPNSMNPHKNSP